MLAYISVHGIIPYSPLDGADDSSALAALPLGVIRHALITIVRTPQTDALHKPVNLCLRQRLALFVCPPFGNRRMF